MHRQSLLQFVLVQQNTFWYHSVPTQMEVSLCKQEMFGFCSPRSFYCPKWEAAEERVARDRTGRDHTHQDGFSSRLFCLVRTKKRASLKQVVLVLAFLCTYSALQEKSGCETLVTHSIHVLPIDMWLMLFHSCFRTFCNYLFIDVCKKKPMKRSRE